MPRVSQAVAAETRRRIINVSFDIAMNEGFDKLTFGTIAKRAGITRSGINAHFKLKADLVDVLTPMFAEVIEKPLIFSSPDAFFTSWVYAIHHESEFVKAISHAGAIISPRSGVKGLFERIAGEPADVERCIYMSIGYAVVHLTGNGDSQSETEAEEETTTA
ncbi:TetR/AcrR family transcriptional regulator [Photobacterium alginatilyticum]|uniref:TetR/AcrR family transcriptional regulator n=1 Tax=Photobacterium alginatilyticum TaxID=1775171 RepID=UPI0040676420